MYINYHKLKKCKKITLLQLRDRVLLCLFIYSIPIIDNPFKNTVVYIQSISVDTLTSRKLANGNFKYIERFTDSYTEKYKKNVQLVVEKEMLI